MSRGARIAGAVALWLGALVVGLYFTSNNNDSDPEGPNPDVAAVSQTTTSQVTVVTTPTPQTETTTTVGATTTTVPSDTTTTAPPTTVAPGAGVAIQAALTDGQFSVAGIVPDQATADRITQAATIVYGPSFESSLEIDPNVVAPPWLAAAPQAVTLLPIIGRGSLTADLNGVSVSGAAPNEASLAALQGALAQTLGVEPDVAAVEITNLGFPPFNARKQNDALVLKGALANEGIKANIVNTAIAVYGENAVDDQITIDETLDAPFWSYTMPGVLQLFAAFDDYEINIENGITGGSLNDGANFETGSAELDDETIAILPIALGIMTRDPSVGMEVAGHTDSLGDESFNQSLSEDRAQAVADWLIGAGVDPARIRAVGFGETQPIADNSNSAGRAANRRVEFRFGPAAVILGG